MSNDNRRRIDRYGYAHWSYQPKHEKFPTLNEADEQDRKLIVRGVTLLCGRCGEERQTLRQLIAHDSECDGLNWGPERVHEFRQWLGNILYIQHYPRVMMLTGYDAYLKSLERLHLHVDRYHVVRHVDD